MRIGPSLEYWYLGTFLFLLVLQYQGMWRQMARETIAASKTSLKRGVAKSLTRSWLVAQRGVARLPNPIAVLPKPLALARRVVKAVNLKSLVQRRLRVTASSVAAEPVALDMPAISLAEVTFVTEAEAPVELVAQDGAAVEVEAVAVQPDVDDLIAAAAAKLDAPTVFVADAAVGIDAAKPASDTKIVVISIKTTASVADVAAEPSNDELLRERMKKVVGLNVMPFEQPAKIELQPEAAPAAAQPAARGPFKAVEDLLKWLPGNSDPDLWHLLVGTMNYKSEHAFKVVEWIVGRPHCDRATAALALIQISAESCMRFATIDECMGWDRHRWTIARIVCERSEKEGYPIMDFNLSGMGHDDDQVGLLETLAARAAELSGQDMTLPWPVPVNLLSQPFDGRNAISRKYDLEGGALWLRDQRVAA